MAPQDPPPFTAFTGTNAPNTGSFNSMMESLIAGSSTRRLPPTAETTSASPTQSTNTANTANTSNASNSPAPSTLSTVPTSRSSSSSGNTSTAGSSASSTGAGASVTNAASNTDGSVAASSNCSGISCSPGLQAAVAVPVVIGVLAIFALAFFLVRRKKRQSARGYTASQEKPKKKWTRHLRIFSFDAELIGSGRFSSNNSMRSGQSLHAQTATHNRDISIHSIDDAAPPYRDAVSHAQPPSMVQTGQQAAAGGIAGTAAATIPRSTSRASAPPPYGVAENRTPTAPATPVSAVRDPFSDTNLVSPVDVNSPFRDPSDDGRSVNSRPTISRNSSIRTGAYPDEFSIVGGSEAGSIREAQVARHVSIASGGRTITNVRNSSHSPPTQTPPSAD